MRLALSMVLVCCSAASAIGPGYIALLAREPRPTLEEKIDRLIERTERCVAYIEYQEQAARDMADDMVESMERNAAWEKYAREHMKNWTFADGMDDEKIRNLSDDFDEWYESQKKEEAQP